jgi:long-chain acyl-CoA synthetase
MGYPKIWAEKDPHKPAVIMAGIGAHPWPAGFTVTYGEIDERSNRLAQYFRSIGIAIGGHVAIFAENHPRYLETCWAAERSGLYFTAINSHLTADEVAYIVDDCGARVLVTSPAKLAVARAAIASCPKLERVLVFDEGLDDTALDSAALDDRVVSYGVTLAAFPGTPVDDEACGASMLYSSGTTGRPKGNIRELPAEPPTEMMPVFHFLLALWRYRDEMIYLSPAPLYHSAPQAAVGLTIRSGGTAVIMERFDPEEYLADVERYVITHSQLVPTMFSRMLKLPAEVRTKYDLSSLETVVHAAAPCPVQVKQEMIEWWGPIIHEYYGATEAIGFSACDSEEWLAHPGTVGQIKVGVLHVLDDAMQECPVGTPGTLWFETPTKLAYFNDPAKSAEATSPDGTMSTVGDVGYIDEEGYLYLTDRKTFMIISGGVNIYPQETEDLLITHPKVADAAVFGVPNPDLGEEVKAVVQPMEGIEHDDALAQELMRFCQDNLSKYKCPRSIGFDPALPRLPTGKLYKRVLRDKYWGDGHSRIV